MLSDEQRQAIEAALDTPLVELTGRQLLAAIVAAEGSDPEDLDALVPGLSGLV